ncbi:MAG: hypothetical protein LRZ88_06750, partial [Candidatus Cloacimonetes bacterium]|nr:hypothetical protein [Candidatus Cloacimonadota bacterium]
LRRCLGELKQTNFIIIDIDDVEDPEEMKLWLELLDPSLDFALTSPSGTGLKLVYRMETPITDDISYMRTYRYLADDLLRNLGLKADEGAKSRAQACYFSHDPDLWENPQCKPLQLSSIPSTTPSQGLATVYDFPKAEKQTAAVHDNSAVQKVSTFQQDYATAQRIVQHLVAAVRSAMITGGRQPTPSKPDLANMQGDLSALRSKQCLS